MCKEKTQNVNDSLHSKLWRRCLKIKDANLAHVQFCALDTIIQHRLGSEKGSLLAYTKIISSNGHSTLKIRLNTSKKESTGDSQQAFCRRTLHFMPNCVLFEGIEVILREAKFDGDEQYFIIYVLLSSIICFYKDFFHIKHM